MKAKHSRLLFILGSLALMALAATVVFRALGDTMIFFYTPTQLAEKQKAADFHAKNSLRIGGLVKKGSITNLAQGGIRFTITDLSHDIPVTYHGLVPSLFRDNQGVVAQGRLTPEGVLTAQTILAKHDETYMPRAVVEQLKASGRWQDGKAAP
ncbi:MAG: cytochrome c maturation protein CcmE [Alphaproteobacteria bacterium]|nr:cytochrome c maturation protein CcmE [Alphaproteobacteria bacterium]